MTLDQSNSRCYPANDSQLLVELTFHPTRKLFPALFEPVAVLMKKVVRSHTKKLTGIRSWQSSLMQSAAAPLVQHRRENGGAEAGEAGGGSNGRFSQGNPESFQVCCSIHLEI